MSAGGVRAFVALPLGAELGARVALQVGAALAGAGREWRLPRPEGLHLTLFFLGDSSPERLERLRTELAPALAACAPPSLALGGAGAFPDLFRPRVLVLFVEERAAAGRLAALHAALLAALEKAGVDVGAEAKKPFRPHVTVARPRGGRARVPEGFASLRCAEPFAADEAVLFESVLDSGGSRYAPLARFPFLGRV